MSWIEVWRTSPAKADVLYGLLTANGIPVEQRREGAGRAIGLIYGPLGEVALLVPQEHADAAGALCRRFAAGEIPASEDDDQG